MTDLHEAIRRTGNRLEAAEGNPLLAFAGHDCDFMEISEAIDRATATTVHKLEQEGGIALALQDLAANMLLVGLFVGQIREERQAKERLAA